MDWCSATLQKAAMILPFPTSKEALPWMAKKESRSLRLMLLQPWKRKGTLASAKGKGRQPDVQEYPADEKGQ